MRFYERGEPKSKQGVKYTLTSLISLSYSDPLVHRIHM